MELISEPSARSLLQPLHEGLNECVRVSWTKYGSKVRQTTPLPMRRMRASVIHNYMCDEARRLFGGMAGINFIEKRNRFLMSVSGRILLRFKKLDGKLRPRNYPTQESLAFDKNLSIPGIPDVSRITVGYSLNSVETEIAAVYVMLFRGSSLEWIYCINDFMPKRVEQPEVAQPQKPKRKRVTAKKPKADVVQLPVKKAND